MSYEIDRAVVDIMRLQILVIIWLSAYNYSHKTLGKMSDRICTSCLETAKSVFLENDCKKQIERKKRGGRVDTNSNM